MAARAPRNLRRHTARILLSTKPTRWRPASEGNPIRLGEKRTLTFPEPQDRHRIDADVRRYSEVLESYSESDQRIYEVPCPTLRRVHRDHVGGIVWPEGKPGKPSSMPALSRRVSQSVQAGHGRGWPVARDEARDQKSRGFQAERLDQPLTRTRVGRAWRPSSSPRKTIRPSYRSSRTPFSARLDARLR